MGFPEVGLAMNRTQNPDQACGLVKQNMEATLEIHRCMWPGIQIEKPFLRSKHSPTAADQKLWFHENTISTAMVIAYLVFTMAYKFKNCIDRLKSHTTFQKMLLHCLKTLGSISFPHARFGDDANLTLKLDMSSGEMVDARCFWTLDFYNDYVSIVWAKDIGNQRKTWLVSKSGYGLVRFSELLSFCLDPQHPAALLDRLVGPAYEIMTHFSRNLDENMILLTESTFSGKTSSISKKRPIAVTMSLRAQMASLIWSGREP